MSKNDVELIRHMAADCHEMIKGADSKNSDLPQPIQVDHLLWMCAQIDDHADKWPISRLQRWIGFIQCGILANNIVDLTGLKSMFDEAKNAFGGADDDLLDHLNKDNPFRFDVGGSG